MRAALLINGLEPARIERILQGFPVLPGRSPERRQEARRALATANSDLFAEPDAPVVLCNARMTRHEGIELLVRAAHPLVTRYPNLRLWFVGDGPYRDAMYQQLRSDGVRSSIAMPGSFADSEDLFAAADVFLQSDEEGLEYFLPLAVASELPIVAVDNPSIRSLIDAQPTSALLHQGDEAWEGQQAAASTQRPSEWIEWCEGATPKGVRISVSNVLDSLEPCRTRAGHLRRTLVRSRPLTETTDAYLGLIARLSHRTPPQHWNHETEAVS